MKHKVIMENWRRFVNEDAQKEVLEEGILSTLAGMMLVLNIGGKEVQVELNDVVDGYKQARAEQMDDVALELKDVLEVAAYNVEVLGDDDGVVELGATANLDSNTEALMSTLINNDTVDTGSTDAAGAESTQTLNVSVAINQMENAPTKEARNDWAQKILDYHEQMGDGSNVPQNVVERAKFYLGK